MRAAIVGRVEQRLALEPLAPGPHQVLPGMRRQKAVLDEQAFGQHQPFEQGRAVFGLRVICANAARADPAHEGALFVPVFDVEPAREDRHDFRRPDGLKRRGERARARPRDFAENAAPQIPPEQLYPAEKL